MTPGVDVPHAHIARKHPAWSTRPGARCMRSSLVLGVLVLTAVVSTRWVRLNVSPSSPLGLYRLTAVPTPLARGTLVVLPVPPEVGCLAQPLGAPPEAGGRHRRRPRLYRGGRPVD